MSFLSYQLQGAQGYTRVFFVVKKTFLYFYTDCNLSRTYLSYRCRASQLPRNST